MRVSQLENSLRVEGPGVVARTEQLYGDGASTYELQLAAFVEAVRVGVVGAGEAGSAEDAALNMELIDRIYAAAGLEQRSGFK